MAAQSSLYNEDRNLLRIKEQERRNHEAVQERCPFQDQAPLFPEPYKRSRGDELSSRIQSMLGNYEEVKELIGAERNQNFIGIPKSALPVSTQGKSDRLNSFNSGAHRPVGASNSSIVPSGQRNRHYPGPEPVTRHLGKSQSCAQGNLKNNTRKEQPGIKAMDKIGRRVQDFSIEQLASPSSISALSPLLSSLSPPGEPLSPLHSTHDMDSMPQGSHSRENVYNHVKSSPSPSDTGKKDGPSSVTNLIPSTQGFPTTLTSKTNVMPQKPTAYVRPMDGLDQAPNQSPDLKPLQEDYNEESFGTFADIKGNEKYSKLEMHSVPCETITNDAHCVEEILKEMTHSWPPPLTAIHTPSTAEPTKFPFPTKESQQVPSVKVNQKQYDSSSKVLPSPQEGTSNLEDDLHISESDDSDEEEVSEKPPSSSASSSILQSQAGSVVSAHSGSVNSDSGESDSSSDSDSEGSSSDSEVKVPSRPASPEPDPPTNIWQLQNWLKTPASTENHSNDDHEPQSQWLDNKGQESLSPPPHDSPKTIEPHPKKATWISQEEIQNKMAHPNSLASREAVIPRQTVGIKQPRKPTKAFQQEEPKAGHTGLTVESEPAPYRPRDQPSKEKPTVKTKGKPKSNDFKEPKASIVHTVEKKHKSSHSSNKKCSNFQTDKKHTDYYIQEPSPSSKEKRQSKANHRTSIRHPAVVVREDFHRDKVLLPIGDNRLLPPPSRNIHRPQNLIVKIDLSMLLRVPGAHGKLSHPKGHKEIRQESHSRKKEGSEKKTGQNHSKEHSKRKAEDREKNEAQKKIKMDAGKKSSSHKEFSTKVPKISSESIHKEHLQPKQMSPTQHILKKAEKVAHKRRPSESSTCSQQSTTSIGKSNHKDPSSSKHRKVEEKESKLVKNCKGSTENNANPFPVPSLPNGNAKLTRPQLKFEEKLHSPEHYMKEAKKLKHKADAMSDKIGKAFNYLDAAMFFIECGISMESDVQAPKSAYTMFAETIDLIKFIMKLKNFADSSAPLYEQAFAILCMRCQSLLYMAMFRYKKETAVKYSRTLGEHFKSSCRAAQAPSPCVVRMSGTPSPLSPTPSPASSGGSQPGSIASNSGSQNSSVTIPQMIHQIASSYVNITSYFLYAFDIWEQADLLSKKNKEFFTDLSAVVCPLALNSTMNELVHYTRQGLHWLRLETSMILDGAGGRIQAL
ncbi:AF4/FMR2 family member 1 isoform X2 [Spea bombifrons]|uniref:AF4/FMR2 family member 1 isoform X2 n=1 Tax=Spea bombifrons TaxID=233779 RepID=UPI00234AB7DB|nr:AF4/FMR2 family member 1 isoform X2 [Spea bombifrons]